ncbi:hypothetical protein OH76DRAFT_21903 [Lentinus brumalis]|uniref:Uncharacterized protein n=1 Tax=Lentinus brumalis TaxID=2498619 RepID=A0A371DXC5_9APHY|nr:hypothetical protein OH76DRAFT_21903 [Polyporus brumalis]
MDISDSAFFQVASLTRELAMRSCCIAMGHLPGRPLRIVCDSAQQSCALRARPYLRPLLSGALDGGLILYYGLYVTSLGGLGDGTYGGPRVTGSGAISMGRKCRSPCSCETLARLQ